MTAKKWFLLGFLHGSVKFARERPRPPQPRPSPPSPQNHPQPTRVNSGEVVKTLASGLGNIAGHELGTQLGRLVVPSDKTGGLVDYPDLRAFAIYSAENPDSILSILNVNPTYFYKKYFNKDNLAYMAYLDMLENLIAGRASAENPSGPKYPQSVTNLYEQLKRLPASFLADNYKFDPSSEEYLNRWKSVNILKNLK